MPSLIITNYELRIINIGLMRDTIIDNYELRIKDVGTMTDAIIAICGYPA
jgi:hypothetical protein